MADCQRLLCASTQDWAGVQAYALLWCCVCVCVCVYLYVFIAFVCVHVSVDVCVLCVHVSVYVCMTSTTNGCVEFVKWYCAVS